MRWYGLVLSGLLVVGAGVGVLIQVGWWPDTGWWKQVRELYPDSLTSGVKGAVGLEARRRALRRDNASPYRWCDLGEELARAAEWEQADYCFRRAAVLGPHTPAVLVRVARHQLERGDKREGLGHLRHVLELVRQHDGEVFGLYRQFGVSAEEALAHGMPNGAAAAHSYLRFLMEAGTTGDAMRTWSWMLGRGLARDASAGEYAAFLVRQERCREAARAWSDYLGAERVRALGGNRAFNGDFEAEFRPGPFDWRITPVAGVEVERSQAGARKGQWGLRLAFAGEANLNYQQVEHGVVLDGGRYRLRGYVRTEDVTTDEGVRLRLSDARDPRRLDISTEQVLGTKGWTAVSREFQTGAGHRLYRLQVVRVESDRFDSKIKGTVWLDDVSITRIGPEGDPES